MDTFGAPLLPGDLVEDDDHLLELVAFLAGDARPHRRCLLLTWLDAEDRVPGVLLPLHGVPVVPDDERSSRFGRLAAGVVTEHLPGGSVVAVLERPGGAAITETDRAWNAMLRAQARQHGFRVRGFFVAAGGQVRPLTLDDAG
jgi:hypothetical protein